MREILFRGKRIDNGEWVYGYYSKHSSTGKIFIRVTGKPCLGSYEVDPHTVGQYTGLTGKNGNKIFEGDIIGAPPRASRGKPYGVVEFGDYKNRPYGVDNTNRGFYIRWVCNNEIIEEMLRQDIVFWTSYSHTDVEVVGNICDNSELLKGE